MLVSEKPLVVPHRIVLPHEADSELEASERLGVPGLRNPMVLVPREAVPAPTLKLTLRLRWWRCFRQVIEKLLAMPASIEESFNASQCFTDPSLPEWDVVFWFAFDGNCYHVRHQKWLSHKETCSTMVLCYALLSKMYVVFCLPTTHEEHVVFASHGSDVPPRRNHSPAT